MSGAAVGEPPEAEAILDYWFGPGDDVEIAARQAGLWWGHAPETDREIRERFGALLERAGRGELDGWAETARGRLALIVLLDQFSRNVHRGTGAMFAQDERALGLCLRGLALRHDRELRPIERLFFYLPLEHSEELGHQERCVELTEELAREVPAAWRETFDGFVDFAVRHRDIVARFGRFPHRNALLGREATSEELEFLEQPGSSF